MEKSQKSNDDVLVLISSKEQPIDLTSTNKLPRPIVTITIGMIDIFVMIFSYAIQDGFGEQTSELWIRMGAKYAPCMKPLDSELEQTLYNKHLKFQCHSFLFPYQFYRYLTPIFIHDNLTHLLSNLVYQIITGTVIEQKYGGKILVISYVLFGVSGNLLSTLYNTKTGQ